MYKYDKDMICPWDETVKPWYPEYYKVKYDICKKVNPKKIVEIGVRAGYSANAFLQACPYAVYHGFDADNGTHGGENAKGNKPYIEWANEQLSKKYDITIHKVDTQSLVQIMEADFYHIDGDHTLEGVYNDLRLCYESAKAGAYILIDDYTFLPSVHAGVRYWLKEFSYHNFTIHQYESPRGELLIGKLV